MSDQTTVLQFEAVTVTAERDYDVGLTGVSFEVAAGELMLVLLDKQHPRTPLADAAEGLAIPHAGRVAFLRQDWTAMSADGAAAGRARIGRVFRGTAWLSNLDVDENITLRERHTTQRSVQEIEEEALALARTFGLDDLPRLRPAWMSRKDLMRAQWVRALLGRPALLLLESPEADVTDSHLAALGAALAQARGRGAAIVWFTSDLLVWNDRSLQPQARYALRGQELVRSSEEMKG